MVDQSSPEICYQTVVVTPAIHRIRPDPQLACFTTSNDPLPTNLYPILSKHLSNISDAIFDLKKQQHILHDLLLQTERSRSLLAAERSRWESLTGVRSLPVEILTQVFHHTLEAQKFTVDPHQVVETDPFQMSNLRLVCKRWNNAALAEPTLWRRLQLDLDRWDTRQNASLTQFVDRWTKRAGEGYTGLPLALVGSNDQDLRAGEIVGDGQPVVELMQLLFDQKYHWTEWHISSGLLRRLVRRSGLQGLLSQHESSRSCELFEHAAQRLVSLSITEKWTPYRLFRSVEDAEAFKNLRSLYLAHPDNRGLARSKFDAHLPPSLQYLQISGAWSYSMDRLFQLASLEELVLEAASSCTFEAPSRSPLLHPSLKRFVLIEHHAISKLTQILRHLTLPSLQLIQICHTGLGTADDWRQQNLAQHFARSSNSELHLSLEHSELRRRNLVKALAAFEGVKIDCLYVDDVDAILDEPDIIPHLGHSIHALACRHPPTLDKPNIPRALGVLSALDPKLTLCVPWASAPFSEEVADILDLRYLSDYALGEMFGHGVEGHQHQRTLNHLLQGRQL